MLNRGEIGLILAFLTGCRGISQGPASGGPDDPGYATSSLAKLQETADFQYFTLSDTSGPCAPQTICRLRLSIDKNGLLTLEEAGRRSQARLDEADLRSFAALAVRGSVIAALRVEQGCRGSTDVAETMEVGLAVGLFTRNDTAGCNEGPIATVRASARNFAKKYFNTADEPIPVPPLSDGPTATLDEKAEFYAMHLQRSWGECLPESICRDEVSLEPRARFVSETKAGKRRLWTEVDTFLPVASVAVTGELIAALRTPGLCVGGTDMAESVTLGVATRLYVRADIHGCSSGPIEQLRGATRALIDRLAAAMPNGQ
jgi:hypothetical protein